MFFCYHCGFGYTTKQGVKDHSTHAHPDKQAAFGPVNPYGPWADLYRSSGYGTALAGAMGGPAPLGTGMATGGGLYTLAPTPAAAPAPLHHLKAAATNTPPNEVVAGAAHPPGTTAWWAPIQRGGWRYPLWPFVVPQGLGWNELTPGLLLGWGHGCCCCRRSLSTSTPVT